MSSNYGLCNLAITCCPFISSVILGFVFSPLGLCWRSRKAFSFFRSFEMSRKQYPQLNTSNSALYPAHLTSPSSTSLLSDQHRLSDSSLSSSGSHIYAHFARAPPSAVTPTGQYSSSTLVCLCSENNSQSEHFAGHCHSLSFRLTRRPQHIRKGLQYLLLYRPTHRMATVLSFCRPTTMGGRPLSS
jgi:hypothetical protein